MSVNLYGETKVTVEKILRDLSKADTEFRYVSLRYFNVGGADSECQIGETHNPERHI
ncbi:MAG: NAD-dependent epimerase/dehydratase family protein [Desulfurococcaceae archaeon]